MATASPRTHRGAPVVPETPDERRLAEVGEHIARTRRALEGYYADRHALYVKLLAKGTPRVRIAKLAGVSSDAVAVDVCSGKLIAGKFVHQEGVPCIIHAEARAS